MSRASRPYHCAATSLTPPLSASLTPSPGTDPTPLGPRQPLVPPAIVSFLHRMSLIPRPRRPSSLSSRFDRDGHDRLLTYFETQPDGACDYNRFKDIRHAICSSKWLCSVDPRSHLTLEPEAYISATRLRLRADFTSQQNCCRLCNRTLDINATHALC